MNPRTHPLLFALFVFELILKLGLARYAWKIRKAYPVFAVFTAFLSVKALTLYATWLCDPCFTYFYSYYTLTFGENLLFLCFISELFVIFFGKFIGLPKPTVSKFITYTVVLLVLSSVVGVSLGHTDADSVIGWTRVAERCASYVEAVALGAMLYLVKRYRMPWRSRMFGMALGAALLVSSNVIINTVLPYCSAAASLRIGGYAVEVLTIIWSVVWLWYIAQPEKLRAVVSQESLAELQSLVDVFSVQIRAAKRIAK